MEEKKRMSGLMEEKRRMSGPCQDYPRCQEDVKTIHQKKRAAGPMSNKLVSQTRTVEYKIAHISKTKNRKKKIYLKFFSQRCSETDI